MKSYFGSYGGQFVPETVMSALCELENAYKKIAKTKKFQSELKELLSKDESLKPWLGVCAVSLNDEVVSSLKEPLRDGDIICVLPPVCGG